MKRFWRWVTGQSSWDRFVARQAEHRALVEAQAREWEAAHPELVAQGIPAPPTRESITLLRYGGIL
jgi:hypothetical protein